MTQWHARLFGSFAIVDARGNPLDLGSPTTRSLLAYLLLHRHQPLERRRLAFLFWPNATESAARRNLRQYLHHVRMVLSPLDPEGTWLQADGSVIHFQAQTPIEVDVETFQKCARPEASLADLEEAIRLYRGDLLEDLYEDWCLEERERLHRLWLDVLERYSRLQSQAGRFSEAIHAAQKWMNAEPYDEHALRRLLQLYALSGDRPRALQVYQGFVRRLAEDLGVEPLPETQSLARSLLSGELPAIEFKSEPQSVQDRRPALARAIPPIPLVDREAELRGLEELYLQAQAGQGRLVFVRGEAGIGKTRLIQEYLGRHPQLEVLYSVCYEAESMQPFAPLRQALEAYPGFPSSLLLFSHEPYPSWLAQIVAFLPSVRRLLPDLPAAGNVEPQALREALLTLLLQLSEQKAPLHLILDDLQWADLPTWEWLVSMARRFTTAPLLVIGLYRPEDLVGERQTFMRLLERSDLASFLSLSPLSAEDSVRLAAHLYPPVARDALLGERLYRDTEGNPFFIIETIKAIQEGGNMGGVSPLMTASIQQVIRARLERLPPSSQETLTAAAVFGRPFSLAFLHTLLERPREELVQDIECGLERGLIQEVRQGYDFRHDKIRQVAYQSLSRARREYLHGRIAELLENSLPRADDATLAYHYSRSDQPLKALPYLIRAGEQALLLRSYHEARQFGLQAINLLAQGGPTISYSQRITVGLQLAQAYAFSGDLRRASEILSETEHLAYSVGDEAQLAQIFRRAAQFFWLRGQVILASDYARRTLRAAEEQGDAELLSAALRMLGRTAIALAAFDDAIAYLLRLVGLYEERAETLQRPLPQDMPIVLGYLGVAYSRVGAWERAFSCAQRGVEMALQRFGREHPTTYFALMQSGMVQAAHRDWRSALETLRSIPLPGEDQITPPTYMATALRGYVLAQSGQFQEGVTLLRRAIAWAQRHEHRIFHYLPYLFLGESLMLANQIPEALQEVNYALEEAQKVENRWAVGMGWKLLAEIKMHQTTPPWTEIEDHLLQAVRLLRQVRARPDLARTYLALRRLYDRAGQIAWAVDCHFRAITIFEELGMMEELRQAQGQPAYDRQGAVVLVNLPLRGPNVSIRKTEGL